MGGSSSSSNTTATSLIAPSLKGVSMGGMTTEITGVLPIVLPVLIAVIALRKGISFLMGTLRGC